MSPEHECRQGRKCKARRRDQNNEWHGCGVDTPGLCRACEESAFDAIPLLASDWCELDAALTVKQKRGVPQYGKTTERPSPLNLQAEALAAEIVNEVVHWSNVVTGGDDLPGVVRYCVEQAVTNIVTRKGTLIDQPLRRYSTMLPLPFGGDHLAAHELDGVDAVLRLARLHHRTTTLLGLQETRTWLPDPCPHCGRKTLSANKDQTLVSCKSCHITWAKEQFAWLSNVLESEKVAG